jgi:hypothetical protein
MDSIGNPPVIFANIVRIAHLLLIIMMVGFLTQQKFIYTDDHIDIF